MEKKQVVFEPPTVRFDVEFWKWLTSYKLNEQMLGTDPIRIQSDAEYKSGCILGSQSRSVSGACYEGLIYNVNTIEDFTSKATATKRNELLDDIKTSLKNCKTMSSSLFPILVVSFAELKTYKFVFNCALPVMTPATPLMGFIASCSKTVLNADGLVSFGAGLNEDSETISLIPCAPDLIDATVVVCKQNEVDPSDPTLPWFLRNILYILFKRAETVMVVLVSVKTGHCLKIEMTCPINDWTLNPGWVKFGNSFTGTVELRTLLDSAKIAEEAVTLNVKLMKWRLVPELEPEMFSNKKFLLLGAGTLGCSVARALIGWGVKKITFIDSGKVAFSNPARQSLFTHKDAELGRFKAEAAAERLKEVVPSVESEGVCLEIPMPGHPASLKDESYDRLKELIDTHDVIMMLTDSRESRWLPSILSSQNKDAMAVAVALGFDSFLVKLQKPSTACYFCNDVSAPADSTAFRALDLQCTVTRPGVAMAASALAVELIAAYLTQQDPSFSLSEKHAPLGAVPDQIRGFLGRSALAPALTEPFSRCICCSQPVMQAFADRGREFVKEVVNDSSTLERISKLSEMKSEMDSRVDDVINLDNFDSD